MESIISEITDVVVNLPYNDKGKTFWMVNLHLGTYLIYDPVERTITYEAMDEHLSKYVSKRVLEICRKYDLEMKSIVYNFV